MKYILVLSLFLVACGSNPTKPQLITKDHYIVKEIPPEYFVIPAPLEKIDVDTATQKDVSLFIVNMDNRITELETKLIGAKKVQDENIKSVK